jgi:hypothetical protein
MTERHLHQALRTLREQIGHAEGIDNASRQRLKRLTATIEQRIKKPQQTDHHESLIKLLRDEVAYFEVSHPKLTTALNEVAMILSAGGF